MKILFLALLLAQQPAQSEAEFLPRQFSDFQKSMGDTIPFPPENFIQSLLALDLDSSLNTAILPHGRSLERTATDFQNPRTVMAWQSGASRTPYFLYVAYTPGAEELEVIAWNWDRRQFDFKFVKDYAPGKIPRLVNASRPLCMACHQNGGPIFPQFPWSETTQNSEIRNQLNSQATDALAPFILNLSLDPAVRVRLESSIMDFQVHAGNFLLQNQNICANACGADLPCRKGLLLSALLESIASGGAANISAPWLQTMHAAMLKSWPSDGFGFLSDSVSDRTLIPDRPLRFEPSEDPLLWRDPTYVRGPAEGTAPDLLAGYAQCWSFSAEQTRQLNSWGPARLEAAMDTAPMASLVQTWLPSETTIIATISQALKNPRAEPWPPKFSGDPFRESLVPLAARTRYRRSTPELFTNYCASCHGGPNPRPPILPLADLHALSLYIGSADRTVSGLLDPSHPIMPPAGAPQPSAEERRQMLSELH